LQEGFTTDYTDYDGLHGLKQTPRRKDAEKTRFSSLLLGGFTPLRYFFNPCNPFQSVKSVAGKIQQTMRRLAA
jgi:hypothetical protein